MCAYTTCCAIYLKILTTITLNLYLKILTTITLNQLTKQIYYLYIARGSGALQTFPNPTHKLSTTNMIVKKSQLLQMQLFGLHYKPPRGITIKSSFCTHLAQKPSTMTSSRIFYISILQMSQAQLKQSMNLGVYISILVNY